LIGLRALHLFKEEWHIIHKYIKTNWDLNGNPIANYREGDTESYVKKFEEEGCDIKKHKFGYRSIHYIVETKPAKNKYFAEIQVRTIFEEAWSEIDHRIRYPYDQENRIFGQFVLILNRLAGSADEMGSFILNLQHELERLQEGHKRAIDEKDNIINNLKEKLKQSNLKESDQKIVFKDLEKLQQAILNMNMNFNISPLPENFRKIKIPATFFLDNFLTIPWNTKKPDKDTPKENEG
jgi:putative GTP pyrophosphokinase